MISISDKNPMTTAEMEELWKTCFHDSPGFTDFYFREIYKRNIVVEMKENGHVIGMIHMNPYAFSRDGEKIIRGYFIVGVAVDPAWRRRGCMKKMLQYAIAEAEERAASFLYLWPADVRYYQGSGFRSETEMDEILLPADQLKTCAGRLRNNSHIDEAYGEIRNTLYRPVYSGQNIACLEAELSSEGGRYISPGESGIPAGSFSLLPEGDSLTVEHVVPGERLSDFMADLLDMAAETCDGRYHKVRITLDHRIARCLKEEIPAEQILFRYPYMVLPLRRLIREDPGDFLFTEVV